MLRFPWTPVFTVVTAFCEIVTIQLFFEVFAKKPANCCCTFPLPHFGHLGLFFPCSEKVIVTANFFLQSLQMYS